MNFPLIPKKLQNNYRSYTTCPRAWKLDLSANNMFISPNVKAWCHLLLCLQTQPHRCHLASTCIYFHRSLYGDFFFFFKTRCVNRGKNKYNQHVSLWSIQSWTPGALKKRALCVLHTQLNKHSDKHKNSAILGVWCGKKSTEKPDPVWPPFHLMGIVEPPGESSSSTYIKCVLLICLDNFFFFF